ncbi:MAG: hypothetical protein R3E89_00540 [Thiolinea sp.]
MKQRILFGVSNPPQYDYPLQVLEVFKRLNIGVKRAYVVKMSNGVYPSFLATFMSSRAKPTSSWNWQ